MTNKKIIIIAVSCFTLLVLTVSLYMWRNGFSVGTTGTLGDGFNGLLTPFISFAGALLVYLSFNAQVEANRKQFAAYEQQVAALNEQRKANELMSTQWLLNTYLQMLDDIRRDFDKVEVQIGAEKYKKLGVDGVNTLANTPWNSIYRLVEGLNQVSILLAQILFLIGKLKETPTERQEFVWHKLHLWYELNLLPYLPGIRRQIIEMQKGTEYQFFIGRIDKVMSEIFDFEKQNQKN